MKKNCRARNRFWFGLLNNLGRRRGLGRCRIAIFPIEDAGAMHTHHGERRCEILECCIGLYKGTKSNKGVFGSAILLLLEANSFNNAVSKTICTRICRGPPFLASAGPRIPHRSRML